MIKRTKIDSLINTAIEKMIEPFGDYFVHDSKNVCLRKSFDEYEFFAFFKSNQTSVKLSPITKLIVLEVETEFQLRFLKFEKWRKKPLGTTRKVLITLPPSTRKEYLLQPAKSEITNEDLFGSLPYEEIFEILCNCNSFTNKIYPEMNNDAVLDVISVIEKTKIDHVIYFISSGECFGLDLADWKFYKGDIEGAKGMINNALERLTSTVKEEDKKYPRYNEMLGIYQKRLELYDAPPKAKKQKIKTITE